MEDSSVSLLERADAVCVKMTGSAGVDMAMVLRNDLTRLGASKDVLLDWGEAEHVDASVLQVLLAFQKLLHDSGRSLSVERDNSQVREYLQLSGLAGQFPIASAQSSHSPGNSKHA